MFFFFLLASGSSYTGLIHIDEAKIIGEVLGEWDHRKRVG